MSSLVFRRVAIAAARRPLAAGRVVGQRAAGAAQVGAAMRIAPRRLMSEAAKSSSENGAKAADTASENKAEGDEKKAEDGSAAAESKAEEGEVAKDERDAKIEELEARVKELTDLRLRALAETENVRKRYQAEVEKTRVFGVEGMAKDLLSVVDALSLAIKHMPAEAHAEDASPALVSVRDGILITERALAQVLNKNGITKVESEGAEFDPRVHDLKLQVDVPGKEPNTVVEVIRDGYMLGGRAIRAAEVIATKPAPKK